MDIYAQTLFTNSPKSGQFRGFGSPQSTFALECTLDELIQRLDEDPIAFRLKNKIQQSTKTFLGYPVAETLGYTQVLEALRPRYREFQDHALLVDRDRPHIGVELLLPIGLLDLAEGYPLAAGRLEYVGALGVEVVSRRDGERDLGRGQVARRGLFRVQRHRDVEGAGVQVLCKNCHQQAAEQRGSSS